MKSLDSLSVASLLACLFACGVARAESPPTASEDPTAEGALEITGGVVVGAMKGSKPSSPLAGAFSTYDDYLGGQLAIDYRLSRRVSLGLVGAYWESPGPTASRVA